MSYEDEAAEPTTPISGKQKQLSLFAALSVSTNSVFCNFSPDIGDIFDTSIGSGFVDCNTCF